MLRYSLSLVFILTIYMPVIATDPTQLIHSSVKIRVDSTNGHDWGTGTIIDTRQGPEGQEALILTCGHIFRGWQEGKTIEVHLFGENSVVKVLGACLLYDLEVDLALVRIAPPCPVKAVPIAPQSYTIQPAQQAWSVGCDNGGNPTVWTHQIISVDKISQTGAAFHYVQVSGAPVSGRSGGGLFSREGYLIGVCNTGCPTMNDGHFVPPQMIRHILDRVGLAHIHQNPSLGTVAAQVPSLTALTPLAPIAAVPAPMYAEQRTGMSREEQATLEEIERYRQDGDEVIVIVRSTRNPQMRSDVIVLNSPSEQFMNALMTSPAPHNQVILSSQEQSPQPARQPVSLPVRY